MKIENMPTQKLQAERQRLWDVLAAQGGRGIDLAEQIDAIDHELECRPRMCSYCGADCDGQDGCTCGDNCAVHGTAETTKVVFRAWKTGREAGQVLALFPEILGQSNTHIYCLSYEHDNHEHIGLYSSVEPYGIKSRTRPANPEEYNDLKTELESINYKLDIRTRMNLADADNIRYEAWKSGKKTRGTLQIDEAR